MIKKLAALYTLVFLVLFCAAANDKYVKVYPEKIEKGYIFYAENKHFIPYTVTLDFPSLTNMESSASLPYTVVIPPETKKMKLLTLTMIEGAEKYGYSSSTMTVMGDPENAAHDDGYLYTIPFEHGTKHKLAQGFHGRATHTDPVNAYAVDFNMDIGTPICAARDGVVVEVKENSKRGGPGMEYAKYANLITVYHKDGSFANYVHLKYNGAIVKVGDTVKTGQIIGYSGNTGRSSGPHLHFSVNMPDMDGGSRAVPFTFLYEEGRPAIPEEGKYYYAFHKGGEDFVIESADNITNKDYEDHLVKVKENKKLNFRYEKIDDTSIIFIQNGYNTALSIDFAFSLTNMVASKPIPLKQEVPPLSEIFLIILKPDDPGKPIAHRISTTSVTPVE